MLHFSCDLCGHQLDEQRYVVKLEVYPAFDPDELTEGALDADHLAEVAEIIQEMEATGSTELEDCGAKSFRFDLCPRCHKKFCKDPLGRDAFRRLNFSEN
jgi:tRNA(Ile)-lysidine synthase TilS/MesJ